MSARRRSGRQPNIIPKYSFFAAGYLLAAMLCCLPQMVRAGVINWTEDFQDNPLIAGRFGLPAGHDPARFSYHGAGSSVIIHVDTEEPTAWYIRPLIPSGTATLDECSDFEFQVHFRIHSAGFFADPNAFAQVAWGLLNSSTTGEDRSGGSAGPFAFDCVSFDFFPNVSPQFGGPTLASTVVQSDIGQGFFSAINFPFGPESDIKTSLGDQFPGLDVTCVATVAYRSDVQISTLSISQGGIPLNINSDGSGGPGGPDLDPTTIQTSVTPPFEVDSFALMAWQDTFAFGGPSLVADVEVFEISITAVPLLLGDLNRDGLLNGRDIGEFTAVLAENNPTPCEIRRMDFDQNQAVTVDDISGFVGALTGN